jgi:F1F0 ATPase subunit 2
MTMHDVAALALVALGGAALGVLFYEGLYRTIGWGMDSTAPALWFAGSLLLRTGLVLAGFYAIAAGNWQRLLACFTGFVLARVVVTRYRSAHPGDSLAAAGPP